MQLWTCLRKMVINSCTIPRGRGYTVFAKQCGTFWFYQEWDRDLNVALRYSCAWMALFDLIIQMHFERSHHIPVKSSWPYTATQHERINNKARIKKFDGIAAKLPSVNPTSHYVLAIMETQERFAEGLSLFPPLLLSILHLRHTTARACRATLA